MSRVFVSLAVLWKLFSTYIGEGRGIKSLSVCTLPPHEWSAGARISLRVRSFCL